jgi:hypothetical protein
MDDWVVLSPTRWKLRKAIKKANQVLAQLKVEKHPDIRALHIYVRLSFNPTSVKVYPFIRTVPGFPHVSKKDSRVSKKDSRVSKND